MVLWPGVSLFHSALYVAVSICICRAIHILFVRLARYAIWISMYPTIWLANNKFSLSLLCLLCLLWLLLLRLVLAARFPCRIIVFCATLTLIHTPICTASTVSCSFSPSFTQLFPIRVNAFFAVVTTATATATLTSTTATGERDERLRTALGSFSAVAVRNPTCVSWAVCVCVCVRICVWCSVVHCHFLVFSSALLAIKVVKRSQ